MLAEQGSFEDLTVVSSVGNPAGYVTEHGLVNSISIRHSYDARALGRLSNQGSILEIGGGHGGLGAKIIRNGQFKKYIDCDLPIMLCVAFYFLSKTFPEKKVNFLPHLADGDEANELLLESDVLLISAHNPAIISNLEIDGVFNSYSFSEMTDEIVDDYIRNIEASSAKFVIHENYSGLGKQHPHLVPAENFRFLPS